MSECSCNYINIYGNLKRVGFSLILLLLALPLFSQSNIPIETKFSRVSNIKFYINNNGNLAFDRIQNIGGLIWPYNSENQYLHGAGFYVICRKNDSLLMESSYDLATRVSHFVPGSVIDGANFIYSNNKYRVYDSRLYDKQNGEELFGGNGPNWPIWKNNINQLKSFFGVYENDVLNRNTLDEKEPNFIADQELIIKYKDTDISVNEFAKLYGDTYPIGLEVETRLHFFESSDLRNTMGITWIVKNVSGEDLKEFYFIPAFDIDITSIKQSYRGIDNDIMFKTDKGITTFSTGISDYEKDKDFGFISFDWIITPNIDESGFVKENKGKNQNRIKPLSTLQLDGFFDIYSPTSFLKLFDENPKIKAENDQRFILPVGSFDLKSGTEAYFTIGIALTDADGLYPQLSESKQLGIENQFTVLKSFYDDAISGIDSDITRRTPIIQVFPVPIVNEAFIFFESDRVEQAFLFIYDLNGNKLGTVFDGYLVAGENRIEINDLKLSPGAYFLELNKQSGNITQKIIIKDR